MGEEDKVNVEEKVKEKEMSTEDDIDKPEKQTKFQRMCQRHGINSNLIMLKITLFVMYGGRNLNVKIKPFFVAPRKNLESDRSF